MRLPHLLASITLAGAVGIIGCSNPLAAKAHAAAPSTAHDYTGTASVGDFITMIFDASARTFSYVNHSNALTGSGTYTVNSDGSYAITDSSGCFTDAYEIPGFALVLRGTKTGPTQDTVSLVTAMHAQVNTIAGVANQDFNFMQFRTNSGGVEIGHVGMGPAAEITTSSYWPFGASQSTPEPFLPPDTFPGSPIEDHATGALKLTVVDNGLSEDNYLFATTGGLLAVDTGNGSLVCFRQAGGAAFAAANAGSYRALRYGKSGASTGFGNVESPTTGTVDKVAISVDASGAISITDAASAVLAAGTITPLDGTMTAGIQNACPGLFHLALPRTAADGVTATTQELFLTFVNGAIMFCSFEHDPTSGNNQAYDYFYGVALKQDASNG